jgi:hypothetical protein
MKNQKLQNFIAEKIDDLKYAIFYCHSNDDFHINNSIIHSSSVNDDGTISFFINRPNPLLIQYTHEFPVGLNYFRKGKNYFMNILGKALVVYNKEEAASLTGKSVEEMSEKLLDKALVIVTISKVDFWDTNFERKNLLFKKVWSLCCSMFDWFGTVSRSYYFGKQISAYNF